MAVFCGFLFIPLIPALLIGNAEEMNARSSK